MRLRAPALLIAALLATAPAAAQQDEPCRGARDNTELAGTDIDVVAAKREAFLNNLRAYGVARGLSISTASDRQGWIIMLLEARPAGVTIEIESIHANAFRAVARTCNATEDWRPYWTPFKAYIDANRDAWRA